MKTIIFLGVLIGILYALTTAVVAAPSGPTLPPADNAEVITLGRAFDPGTGRLVEGRAIIHRKTAAAKPSGPKPGATTCYAYLAKGAKWKSVEPWVANFSNTRGLDETILFNLLDNVVAKWEEAVSGLDILGPGSTTAATLVADSVAPDDQNEIYFAGLTDADAIAVTIVWGIFSGPPGGRQLVEWDQVYDDVKFDWSAESVGVFGKMDFDNIATHELGHSFGLADLYNTCVDETMYGFSATAEIKKRDLGRGDISGLNGLY